MPHRLYRITKMPNKTQQWLYNKNKKTPNLIDNENVSPTFYRAVWRKIVTERDSMTFHSQNPLMCCTQTGTSCNWMFTSSVRWHHIIKYTMLIQTFWFKFLN